MKSAQTNKLAIVGSHPVSKYDAPYDDPTWDIWVFNEAASLKRIPRYTAVFQLHVPHIFKDLTNRNDPKHWEWLQQPHDFPIYMQEHYPEVPASVRFPLEDVLALMSNITKGGDPVRFYTSSPAYAIGLGILQGYTEIALYGIEMNTGTEYIFQREGIAMLVGLAAGMGVKVRINPKSELYSEALYGYGAKVMIGRQEFELTYHKLAQAEQRAAQAVNEASGAVKAVMELLNEETDPERQEQLSKRYLQALNAQQNAIYHHGKLAGMCEANMHYLARCDAMIKAAGGEPAVAVLEAAELAAVNG